MNQWQEMVKEFHSAFDVLISSVPNSATDKIRMLRERLIEEEAKEYFEASVDNDLVLMADALADIVYVVLGAAVSFGVDLDPVFREVHRSNMSKIGGHKDEGGKWIKPETYSPADIQAELIKQGWEKTE